MNEHKHIVNCISARIGAVQMALQFGDKETAVKVEIQVGENKVSKEINIPAKGVKDLELEKIFSEFGLKKVLTKPKPDDEKLQIAVVNCEGDKKIVAGEYIVTGNK